MKNNISKDESRKIKVVVAVTGASGQLYAQALINQLQQIGGVDLNLIFTDTAKQVWEFETGLALPQNLVDNHSFFWHGASGSNAPDVIFVVPCSMGTLARVANGTSNDLICRACDVALKERKTLIVAPRETPYSLIHLRNMLTLTEAGAVVAPASPSFYKKPESIADLAKHFALRLIALAGIAPLPQEERF